MQIREKKYNYLDPNQQFQYKEKLGNGVQINTYVVLDSEKFLEYQKDLLQDFLADLKEKIDTEVYDEGDLKNNLENGLQSLNVKLKLFADKVTDVERFSIKGYIQIIAGDTIISSMIGDTSILIFRDGKLYYQLHNGTSKKSKIDLFSDFVEGNVEIGDEIIYVGTKIIDVLDQGDIKELEQIIDQDEASFMEIFEKTLSSRIEKEKVGIISNYYIHGTMLAKDNTFSGIKKGSSRVKGKFNVVGKNRMKRIGENKYYVVIGILGIIVLGLLYSVLSALLDTKKDNSITTASGVVIDITIDDIKKDIQDFKRMDPSSDDKSIKYNEIIEKLTLLEQNGKWLEDVENLRGIVEDDYYKGFKIIRIENLSQLDDTASGIKTRQISFNSSEKGKMGDVLFLDYQKSLNIGGTKGALIGSLNDASRGALIEYGIDTNVAGCSVNLLKDGLYCYTSDGRIYNIVKAGIEPVTTTDGLGFPDTVGGLGIRGKANLYVFQPNLNSALNGVFLTRYRNTVGSETIYQPGQNYTLVEGYENSVSFEGNFAGMAIDATFLARNNGKLYQFRRPGNGSTLDVREVKLLGGDTITNKYSNDVKVIASQTSKYVYLFDRINKTFTVYKSNPLKTNDANTSTYNLIYLFSFKFALTSEEVKDICIPDSTGNSPEMYILTNEGINKINLYDYIKSVEEDDTLKAVNKSE